MEVPPLRLLCTLAIGAIASVGVVLLAGFDVQIVHFANESATRPLITSIERECNLGLVPPNATEEARVSITNGGNRRLIVERDNGGCPLCSEAEQLIVEPGSTGELRLIVHTPPRGTFVQQHDFHTNDPSLPVLTLAVRGTVSDAAGGTSPRGR